jgi:hypothetical protein
MSAGAVQACVAESHLFCCGEQHERVYVSEGACSDFTCSSFSFARNFVNASCSALSFFSDSDTDDSAFSAASAVRALAAATSLCACVCVWGGGGVNS